jgi:hypothetical protein
VPLARQRCPHARNALNQALHTLRRDLLDGAVVEGGAVLRLNPEIISADISEFDAKEAA